MYYSFLIAAILCPPPPPDRDCRRPGCAPAGGAGAGLPGGEL